MSMQPGRRRTTGLCTDSNAHLPDDLVGRLGVEVVPATVRVGEREYLVGVDLDVDGFYDLVVDGRDAVTTAEPSAGQFALAYDELAARGCTEILSVHASGVPATTNAARLAAHRAAVPVRIVEAATPGFGVGAAVWAAADALAEGAALDEAAGVVARLVPAIGTVFIADPVQWCTDPHLPYDGDDVTPSSIPVIRRCGDALDVLERVPSPARAAATMAAFVGEVAAACGGRVRVGVGTAHRSVRHVADALLAALGGHDQVEEVVAYRIGPFVGGRLGPSSAACVTFPARAPAPSTPAAS